MLKYLPNIKFFTNSSVNSVNRKITTSSRHLSYSSIIRINKINFSEFIQKNEPQKKEFSFFERLKEKFTFKEEDKINQSKLQKRNEEEDRQIHSTKIDNEMIFTEEERKNLEKLMEEEKENLELDVIDTNIDLPISERKESVYDSTETFEVLISKFNLKLYEPNQSIRKQYNNLKYAEVILPRVNELTRLGFEDGQIKIILQKYQKFLLDNSNLEKFSEIKNLLGENKYFNLTNEEVFDILTCIPNVVELTVRRVSENLEAIRNFFKIDASELKKIILEYPLLISNTTSDIHKLEFYFNLYIDINKEDFHSLAIKFPLLLTATPDNTLHLFRLIENFKIDRKEWREVIERNPSIFIFKYTQLKNVFALLSQIGLKSKDTFEFVKIYPDVLLANRYNILQKKLLLFGDLQMNKSTIRHLIKTYPFILLKSYNSFIDKVFYFSKELHMNIEEVDIYPLIFLYDLKRDIKPRCEIMQRMNKWIPFKEAFSMSVEDLATKLGAGSVEKIVDNAPLYERDLLFRYSKYLTI